MRQNSTELEERSDSGLTPIQEQAAILLASGESISSVSEKVGVNRSTIYIWQQKLTFQCFFNQQHREAKNTMTNSLFGLYDSAINTLEDCLMNGNRNIRLKAALAIIDKVHNLPIGEVDAREVLRKQCMKKNDPFSMIGFEAKETLDENKYNRLLKENGLRWIDKPQPQQIEMSAESVVSRVLCTTMVKPLEELSLEECYMVLMGNVSIDSYFTIGKNGEVRQKFYEELNKAQILNLKKWKWGWTPECMEIETRYCEIIEKLGVLVGIKK